MTNQRRTTSIEHGIWSYRMFGDKKALAAAFRSHCHLSADDYNLMADFFEGKIKLPRGRPPLAHFLSPSRSRSLPIRAAAGEVERLKAEWRSTSTKRSARGDHDRAIELATEKYCPPDRKPSKFAEQLRLFMRRPKRIRDAP